MTRKRTLPIVAKSLMPEILPDPNTARAATDASPRARVRARLRQLSENAALLAAAANLAACGSESHEPDAAAAGLGAAATGGGAGIGAGQAAAGRSGSGGVAGVAGRAVAGKSGGGGPAGYGVVDPLPQPAQVCSTLRLASASAQWQAGQSIALSVQLTSPIGPVTLSAVMATTPVTASITSAVQPYAVKLQSPAWPSSTLVTLAFSCTGGAPTGTFMTTMTLDTSQPANTGAVMMITARDIDAGT